MTGVVDQVDCVVVGAGLAGLTAASALTRRGKTVVVLEARDRVGGRVFTVQSSAGDPIELGAMLINPGHDHITDLVERAGLGFADPAPGDAAVIMSGAVRRMEPASDGHGMTPFEVADLGQGLLRMRRLSERVAANTVWAHANARWLGQPMRNWVRSNLRTPGGQDAFFRVLSTTVDVADPAVTLQQSLASVIGVDLDSLASANDRVRQRRVVGGVAQAAEYLASSLDGQVRLGSPVVSISWDGRLATVVTGQGERFTARDVVVAIPPRTLAGIVFDPALPSWRSDLIDQVPLGNVIKAALVYERPWWRERGFSGTVGLDAGPLRVISDASDPGSAHGVLIGFFEGPEASGVGQWSDTLRERAFAEAVALAFVEDAPEPIEYRELDWAAEKYTAGCHGAHFAPSVWTAAAATLSASEGHIHFAGAEYSPRFTGYMEGAVRSGMVAAGRILRR